jgi:hypothetical protein
MMPYITGGLFIAALGGFYALAYVLNSRTPVPENCKDLLVACPSCSAAFCGHHPSQKSEEK